MLLVWSEPANKNRGDRTAYHVHNVAQRPIDMFGYMYQTTQLVKSLDLQIQIQWFEFELYGRAGKNVLRGTDPQGRYK